MRVLLDTHVFLWWNGQPQMIAGPFDRLLVAQADFERMILGTQDLKIRPYGIPTLGLAAQ